MFIAHLIEIAHTNYLRKRSEPEKPFSIFSGSDSSFVKISIASGSEYLDDYST